MARPTACCSGTALPISTRAGIWVLSDPDVINNVGMSHPENARLAIALIDKLRAGGAVVIDETVHGHAQTPSLTRVLFSFPLVLATIQVLFCALIAMWAAMVRFGPKKVAPPPIAPGKDFLIRNTAALLRYGGHHVAGAARLSRRQRPDAWSRRRCTLAGATCPPTALTEWLERVRLALRGQVSRLASRSRWCGVDGATGGAPAHRRARRSDLPLATWR